MTKTNPDVFVHESSYIDKDVIMGEGTRVWHFCHIQEGARIGPDCSLGQNVNIGPRVHIGKKVKIQNNVSVYEGVILEDYVFCGPSMVFTNIQSPRCEFPQRGSEYYVKTRIGQGASLGANCTIVCGNTVGAYALVGAGSVVTRPVPDYGQVTGVPARLKGWRCRCGEKLAFSLDTSKDEECRCPRCHRKYRKEHHRVSPVTDDPKE